MTANLQSTIACCSSHTTNVRSASTPACCTFLFPARLPAATGGALSVASGRLAYTYGMRGAALSVDTACSSSLVASHFVVSQLATGVSAAGIAAGVGVLLSPSPTAMFQKAGMLAPDGRCKTLDASADGYVRAESAGVLILQSFAAGSSNSSSQAFLAIMAGSAVNQDGRSSSLTAPNGPAQQEVLHAALTDVGLAPGSVTGLQMHGTGTPLGELLLALTQIGLLYCTAGSTATYTVQPLSARTAA
jgi:acyl transferase domain-containing protein